MLAFPGRQSQVLGRRINAMSLKESWQVARTQRRHDVSLRQEAVQQILAEFQQTRQGMALEQQQNLRLFREAIAQQDQHRKADLQPFRAALQAYCQAVQADVQAFLTQSRDRRQAEAQALATELAAFVSQVRQETQAFLADAGADRLLMAQQLSQDLHQFHTELQASVRSLRALIQADTAERQATVQQFLGDCAEWRLQTAAATSDRLQANRLSRNAALNDLFEQFATAKRDRQQHRANLRAAVWGNHSPAMTGAATPTVVRSIPPTTTPSALRSQAAVATPPAKAAPPKMVHPKLTTKSARSISAPPQSTVKPTATGKAPGNALASAPAQPAGEVAHEKAVYNFLHANNGGRLTQIETSLGINRFQAVDALRSLIKKGLVTQRDRVYLIQPVLATV